MSRQAARWDRWPEVVAHRAAWAGLRGQPAETPPLVAGAMAANAALLDALEERAETAAAAGEHELALTVSAVAAQFAWYGHPGRLASPALEGVLQSVAADLRGGPPPAPTPPRQAREILHVLSEAHQMGGHTRLAWRWMTLDADRRHSVALTDQRRRRVPASLTSAADGRVHRLGLEHSALVDRARALASLAAGFDAVVLHVHPFDAVAVTAMALGSPPVIFMNHASNVFWLGTSVADVVVSTRELAERTVVERRGIERARLTRLPIPMEPPAVTTPRAKARAGLGVGEDDVVLLTMASAYKYAAAGAVGFLDLTLPVLDADERIVLLAAGPRPEGLWREAARRTNGRVRALGTVDDVTPCLAAADVYIDSYPFASMTSMLEAANLGIPCVTFAPEGEDVGVLRPDDPGIGDDLLSPRTAQEFTETVLSLARDPERRSALGETVAAGVARAHHREAWLGQLEQVYEHTRATAGPVPAPSDDLGRPGAFDERLLLLHLNGGMYRTIDDVARRHLGAPGGRERWIARAARLRGLVAGRGRSPK